MVSAYQTLQECGFDPKVIVDCGAACGEWSGPIKSIFPKAKVIGIDANDWNDGRQINGADISEIVTLSDEDGKELTFYKKIEVKNCTGDSLFRENSHHYSDHNTIEKKVKTTTLKKILEKHSFDNVDLLKIDTQGSELIIMKGLGEKIKNVEFIQLEVSLMEFNKGGCTFYEIIDFLKKDFIIFDILNLFRINNVKSFLCQMDVLFQNRKSKIERKM